MPGRRVSAELDLLGIGNDFPMIETKIEIAPVRDPHRGLASDPACGRAVPGRRVVKATLTLCPRGSRRGSE
jgi:hypothetical protein